MSTSAVPSPNPVPDAPGLTQIQRVVYTFTAPSRTMTDIGRSASWWLPWLVTAVIAVAFAFAVGNKIGFKQIVQNQMERMPRVQEAIERAPADQRELQLKIQTISAAVQLYMRPAFSLLGYVISAALLLAIFNFGFGAELKFGKVFAIVVYSSLIAAVKTLLGTIVLLAGGLDPATFDASNPIATNLSFFFSADSHKFLYLVSQVFDIFAIWMTFLLALGISRNSKVKMGSAFVAIFALSLVFVAAVGALMAAFT